jgi:hypothetical protein
MYAGVGSTIGEPGGVKCSMAACSPARTSGSGLTHSAGTSQPWCSRCHVAHARAMSSATGVGR